MNAFYILALCWVLGIPGKEAGTGFVLMGAHTQVPTLGFTHSGSHAHVLTLRCTHSGAHIQVLTLWCPHSDAQTRMLTLGCTHSGAHTLVHMFGCHIWVHTLGAHTLLCPGSSNRLCEREPEPFRRESSRCSRKDGGDAGSPHRRSRKYESRV